MRLTAYENNVHEGSAAFRVVLGINSVRYVVGYCQNPVLRALHIPGLAKLARLHVGSSILAFGMCKCFTLCVFKSCIRGQLCSARGARLVLITREQSWDPLLLGAQIEQ